MLGKYYYCYPQLSTNNSVRTVNNVTFVGKLKIVYLYLIELRRDLP
jgi:hypothetical protein